MGIFGNMWEKLKRGVGKVKDTLNGGLGKLTNNFSSFIKKIPQIGNYVNAMNINDIKYAKMSEQAYNPPSEREDIESYIHSQDSDQHCIYSNGRERVLAIRGTETRDNYSDIGTDITIMIGNENESERYKNELEFARTNNIDKITGHSLGGAIAAYISGQLNKPCIIFAPGSGKNQLMNIFKPSKPTLIIAYKVLGDAISFLWNTGTVKILPMRASNPHTIANFV